jgi:hypothetical protein
MRPSLVLCAYAVLCAPSVASDAFELPEDPDDALSLLQFSASGNKKDLCKTGLKKGRFCCGSSCGTCGGRGCQNRPGGERSCCLSDIKASGRKCNGRNMQNCMLPRKNRKRGHSKTNAGPEPDVPPTDITEPMVVEELSLCERTLKLDNVVRNNLGGAGPDSGDEGILFGDVMVGKDLLVSASSAYTPNMLNPSGGVLRNGYRQGFGVINIASGSSVNLEFTLLDSATGAESPDSFVVTFFDGDHGMSHESREVMTVNGMSNFIVHDLTELEITETATDDASLASGVGVATFTSTLRGSKEDNPVSPFSLSGLQEKRSVEVYFENKAKFTANFAATGYVNPQGRNMMFAGASTLTCAPEAKCSSYECPLGWRMKQDAEFTICLTKPCSVADNDSCCFEEVPAIVPPTARARVGGNKGNKKGNKGGGRKR